MDITNFFPISFGFDSFLCVPSEKTTDQGGRLLEESRYSTDSLPVCYRKDVRPLGYVSVTCTVGALCYRKRDILRKGSIARILTRGTKASSARINTSMSILRQP